NAKNKFNNNKKDQNQKQNQANVVEQSIALYIALSASNDNEWILDSGASRHMTCTPGILSDIVKCEENIYLGDNSIIRSEGSGNVKLSNG
ncbi:hypothetical protein KI387_034684, partial [Taxus chinensis]